ncbi:cytochrome P450 [Kitasatospora purpeofusca]|uniref:cytochrome P450 n=1 Tax=Kitasatospora purpeofusca TaxID=67352 RepID=UPI00386BAF30|nr:cytochrome P450 [Kitasatospora purpeofusca]
MTDPSATPADYSLQRDPRCPMDPPPAYRPLREAGGLVRVRAWDGSEPWLVTRHDDARAALSDSRLTCDPRTPGFPHTQPTSAARQEIDLPFAFVEGPEHLVERRLLVKEFTARKAREARPAIQRIVDEAIDGMLAGTRPCDLYESLSLPVATHTIGELLGVPPADRPLLQAGSRRIGSRRVSKETGSEAFQDLNDYFEHLVDLRMREPADDMVSRLLATYTTTDGLTRAKAVSTIQVLFFAGWGPSSYMIEFGVLALLLHPDQLALLKADPSPELLASTVDETLRYATVSVNGRQRSALADLTLGGQEIRAGEGVLVQLDSANRDADVFPDPDTFDITRRAGRHLGFGHGPHKCIGAELSRAEMGIAYETLFRRIPDLKLVLPLDQLPFSTELTLYSLDELLVTW